MEQEFLRNRPSPCLSCTRVPDPRECDNKRCSPWQQWFLGRWEQIRAATKDRMEHMELKPVGVNVGGTHYAPPHRVRSYMQQDPCGKCSYPKGLCTEACALKRAWEKTRGDAML